MKQIFFLLFFSSALLASCQQSGAGNVPGETITAKAPVAAISEVLLLDAYKAKMKELGADVQLVDVRRPNEFLEGHIEGALNIDFLEDGFAQKVEHKLDKDKPVMLYCRSGRRSAAAARELEALGFKEIYDLEGGFLQWQD